MQQNDGCAPKPPAEASPSMVPTSIEREGLIRFRRTQDVLELLQRWEIGEFVETKTQ